LPRRFNLNFSGPLITPGTGSSRGGSGSASPGVSVLPRGRGQCLTSLLAVALIQAFGDDSRRIMIGP
jgi:hypothetical protein